MGLLTMRKRGTGVRTARLPLFVNPMSFFVVSPRTFILGEVA